MELVATSSVTTTRLATSTCLQQWELMSHLGMGKLMRSAKLSSNALPPRQEVLAEVEVEVEAHAPKLWVVAWPGVEVATRLLWLADM